MVLPYRREPYMKLLAHMDGVNASTRIFDEFGHTITLFGNAQISTSQSKFGGASNYNDGSGDYLTLDGSPDFAFGSGNFTIDLYIYRTSSTQGGILDFRPASTNGSYIDIGLDADQIVLYVNSAVVIRSSITIALNTMYHVAVTRSNGFTKLFINGVQSGSTYTDNNVYVNGTNRPVIGSNGYNPASNNWGGYIDELRICKGVSKWTSNFKLPARQYSLAHAE